VTVSENTYSYFSMGEVFDAPLLHGLAELDLSGYGFLPATMRALVESPVMVGLESLNLTKSFKLVPGVPGARALAECAALSGLRRLQLGNNRLGPVAVKHLARSPHLANLRVLDLTNNPLGDKGAVALAESPYLHNLIQLELMHCDIGDTGVEALLASPVIANLIRLNMYGDSQNNRISDRVRKKLRKALGSRVFV
jgi:hypothetical protein